MRAGFGAAAAVLLLLGATGLRAEETAAPAPAASPHRLPLG